MFVTEAAERLSADWPSDPDLDIAETDAVKDVFGARAYETPVSSIKGVTGNPLSAAGPFELAASAMSIQKDLIPPTANYRVPDPQCDLDYVVEGARCARVDSVLINVHGMGGVNASLLIERPGEPA